jgi:hypothetical protein
MILMGIMHKDFLKIIIEHIHRVILRGTIYNWSRKYRVFFVCFQWNVYEYWFLWGSWLYNIMYKVGILAKLWNATFQGQPATQLCMITGYKYWVVLFQMQKNLIFNSMCLSLVWPALFVQKYISIRLWFTRGSNSCYVPST